MADDERLNLHVSVGDVTIEVDGPVDEAETWFESLREDYLSDIDTDTIEAAANGSGEVGTAPDSGQDTASASTQTGSGKSLTLPEYYKTAANPSKRDAILIIGSYLEKYEQQEDFTKGEIEQRAKDAKISLGANVSRDIREQIGDSHMAKVDERDGKDTYHLTISGEEYVEAELLE
jgi:hypothetical protein